MEALSIYSGTVRYYKGMWSKGDDGKSNVIIDSTSQDSWEYSFSNIASKTLRHLVYLLSKEIQEEKELDFPVYIDWETGIVIHDEEKVAISSKRFNELYIKLEK